MRRSSFGLPHFGHFRFGASVIDWKISSACPHAPQT
jgi:hypothetical protein